MKKWLASFMVLIMILASVPEIAHTAENSYDVTIRYMIVTSQSTADEQKYTEVVVELDGVPGSTQLGTQGSVPSTDEGLIKARDFVGWTTVPKSEFHISAVNPLYSPTETVADVFGNQTSGEITLYAYYDGLFERWGTLFGYPVPVPNAHINEHKMLFINDAVNDAESAQTEWMTNATVKDYNETVYINKDYNGDGLNFAEGDRGYEGKHRTVTAFYDAQLDRYQLKLNAVFNMHKGVAYVVSRNRVGQINQSEIYLSIRVPEGVTTPDTIENMVFESAIFKVKDVNGVAENGEKTPLNITNKEESNSSPVTRLSFASEGFRSFEVVAIPKNQDGTVTEVGTMTAKEFTSDMKLYFETDDVFTIDNATAKALAQNGEAITIQGTFDGIVKWQLHGLPMDASIDLVKSNALHIRFAFPTVTFDKNTTAFGDTASQTLEKAAVKDGMVTEALMPDAPQYSINGAPLEFLGWNTKADGSGTAFDANTPVAVDMTVYARWKRTEDPVQTYAVSHVFESNETDRPLPAEVLALLPEDITDVVTGDVLQPGKDTFSSVRIGRNEWHFMGWTPQELTIQHDNALFTGLWRYERVPRPDDPEAPSEPEQPTPPDVVIPSEPEIPELEKTDHKAYMFGYPDLSFQSEGNMTRAEVTAVFSRLLKDQTHAHVAGQGQFIDVQEDAWYYDVIQHLYAKGLLKGYPDGSFQPNGPITRAEFAAMASRFDQLDANDTMVFSDVHDGHWAFGVIQSAAAKGWVAGYPDGTFQPESRITREEVVSVTNRMLIRKADEHFVQMNRDALIPFTDLSEDRWSYYSVMEATHGHDYTRLEDRVSETWLALNGKRF